MNNQITINIRRYLVNTCNPKACLLVAVGLRRFCLFRHGFLGKYFFVICCQYLSIFGGYVVSQPQTASKKGIDIIKNIKQYPIG